MGHRGAGGVERNWRPPLQPSSSLEKSMFLTDNSSCTCWWFLGSSWSVLGPLGTPPTLAAPRSLVVPWGSALEVQSSSSSWSSPFGVRGPIHEACAAGRRGARASRTIRVRKIGQGCRGPPGGPRLAGHQGAIVVHVPPPPPHPHASPPPPHLHAYLTASAARSMHISTGPRQARAGLGPG